MSRNEKIDWVERARELGPTLAKGAAAADREGRFVADNYRLLREGGFVAALVPAELGGGGGGHAEVACMLKELAHHCASTALALSMHSHLVAATVWKYRHGQPGEQLLRRVAQEAIVLVSTGAGDWLQSNGQVTRVDGGYRVVATKPFGSGSPAGDVIVTSAAYDCPQDGPSVLHFPVPMRAEGVRMDSNWDSLGMRGTGSNTIHFEDVFVPDAAIALKRPRQGWHPVWSVVATVAVPLYMAPYVGLAEAAAKMARQSLKARHDDAALILLGELENELAAAQLAQDALMANAREYDFAPELPRANKALIYKTLVTKASIATVEKAMEIVGGSAYHRGRGMERLLRDVRAAPFHPLAEKRQQLISARLALELPPV